MSKRHIYGKLVVANGSGRMIISPDRVPCIAETHGDDSEEHARRLVACWNACANVDTELLEQYPAPFSVLREERDRLLAASHAGKEVWRQDQARIAELMAQRDKLLYAMKHIESHGNKIGFDAVLYARAAIAESEGE